LHRQLFNSGFSFPLQIASGDGTGVGETSTFGVSVPTKAEEVLRSLEVGVTETVGSVGKFSSTDESPLLVTLVCNI
jgi:hypothetical protein